MATETERLLIALEARVNDFEKGMAKARQATDRATRDIERKFDALTGGVSARLRTLAKFAAAGLGGLTLVGLIRDAGRLADELGDTANQLGITTGELQALRYAALETGLSQEKLDTALDSLTRKLGDAVGGSQEAQAQFRALGVDIFDAQGRARAFGPVLEDVARKIKALPNPTDQSAASIDLLGKAGARALPFLDRVAGGLADLTQQASDAGRVMSDETVQALGEAHKELDRLGVRLTVIAGEFAGFLNSLSSGGEDTQFLKGLQDRLAEIDGQLRDLQVAQGSDEDPSYPIALETINALLAERLKILEQLVPRQKLIANLTAGIQETASNAGAGAPAVEGPTYRPQASTGKGGGSKTDSFQSAIDQAREHTAALQAEAAAIGETSIAAQRMLEIQNLQAAATKANLPLDEERLRLIYDTADALAAAAGQVNFEKGLEAAQQQTEALRLQAEQVGLTAEQTDRLKVEQELLNLAMQNGIPLTDELRQQVASVAEQQAAAGQAVRDATAQVDAQRSVYEELQSVGQNAFDSIGSAAVDAFNNGRTAAQSFGATVQSIISDIIKSLIRMLLIKAFERVFGAALGGPQQVSGSAISNVLSSMPYGVYHSGGVAGRPSRTRRADPAVFAGAGRFHSGGLPGLRAGEVPAILQKGELVLPRALVAAMSGMRAAPRAAEPRGGDMVVNIYNRSDASVREQRSQDGNGNTRLDVIIDRVVADKLGRQGTASNRALRDMGVRQRLTRR